MEHEGQAGGSKDTWRLSLRTLRDAMSLEQRNAFSSSICQHLLNLPALHGARRVAIYHAIQSEVDLRQLATQLQRFGVDCLYPRIRGSSLEFAAAARGLIPGPFGLMQPQGAGVLPEQIDCILCPGLGFDTSGNRLGYGKGFYDRALHAYRRSRVGVAFSCCIVQTLPHTPRDRPMDWLVTEEGAQPTKAAATGSMAWT